MKIKPAFLAIVVSVLVGSAGSVVQAKACGDSFYCYGDTAESLATTSTRPPPIPPPNTYLRRLQQRNQEHIALLNHSSVTAPRPAAIVPPRIVTTATHAAALAPTNANHEDGISVLVIPARPRSDAMNRVPITRPVISVACHPAHIAATSRAESLERLGAIAAKRNDRAMSLRFFGEARHIRATLPPC